MPAPAHGKIPATVVTGFLGAGKTTMIRHILQNANGRRIALIINEFGDLGVDGELLKGCGIEGCSDDDVIELSNGCICCTVADDFIPSMTALLEREQQPDHIIIETSGLALPQPLIRAFNWPDVRGRVTVDGVVALIDAAAVEAGRFAQDEAKLDVQRQGDENLDHETPLSELFDDQLASADLVVLNKTDLLDDEQLQQVADRLLQKTRKGVHLIRTSHGEAPLEALLGLDSAAESDLSDRHEVHHHHHHDEDDDGHDHHHHEHGHDEFMSFAVEMGAIDDPKRFAERIAAVIAKHDILRLKGFCAVEGKPMRLVVQAVGPRVDTYFDRLLQGAEQGCGQLVVIGLDGLDRVAITSALMGQS